jgi:tetratricopeptide (TPR) repeat protein
MPQESSEAAPWRLKGEDDLRKAREAKTVEPSELGYLEGLLAYGEGNYAAAGKSLTAYAAANPWDAQALALIGSSFYLAKEFESAIRHLSQALRLESRAGWYKIRGDARCCLGNLRDALADYDACLQLRPQDVDVLCNRAVVLQALGRLEEAERAAGRAIELRPDLARAFNTRGMIRATRRNLDGAMQDFTDATVHDYRSAEAWNNLANVQAMLEDLDQAIRNYDLALSCDPDYAVAFYNRGLALERKGLRDKAAEDYRASLEREPLNPDPRYQLALYLHLAGKREEAIVQLRRAIEAASDRWPRKGTAEQLLRQWTGN